MLLVLLILYDPGTPQDCYSIFLSDEEIRIARRRMKADQKDSKPRENAVKYFSIKIFGKILASWHFMFYHYGIFLLE